MRPGFFHATNLLLHLTACSLVLLLLRRLGHGWRTSLLLSLVLCVHPALVSVVGWIPCRNDSLLAIFVLAAVLSMLRFLARPHVASGAAVLACVAQALFTKESGLGLLVVLPSLALVERGAQALRERPLQLLGVCVGSVALTYVMLRRYALGALPVGLGSVLAQARDTLVVYVGKTLLPVQLSLHPNLDDSSLWPGSLVLGAAVGLLVALRARLSGRFALGIVRYFAFLVPGLFVAPETNGLEHRLYVPTIGLLISAAALRPGTWRVPRPLLLGAALALLAGLAILSVRRLPDFASDLAFWESAARSSPRSEVVWRSLASRYLENGRLPETAEAARRALALRPDEARSHLLLGVALAKQRRFAEAEPALRSAARLDPDSSDAWSNLALLEELNGDRNAAALSRRRADEARAREER